MSISLQKSSIGELDKYMILVQKIQVKETLRTMDVGDEILLPYEYQRAAKVAAWSLPGSYHVYALKSGIKVIRYE